MANLTTSGVAPGQFIRQLWRRRLYEIASNTSLGSKTHVSQANLAEHVRHDYHGRFLIELIQNCADQAHRAGREGTRVLVARGDDVVIIANEGRAFDESGIRSVTSLALSGG